MTALTGLTAFAVIHPDGSFAERLEKAISRSSNGDSHQPKLINHQPAPHSAEELKPAPTPTPRPKPNQFVAGRLMRRRIK
jgi:hypothetical protein